MYNNNSLQNHGLILNNAVTGIDRFLTMLDGEGDMDELLMDHDVRNSINSC